MFRIACRRVAGLLLWSAGIALVAPVPLMGREGQLRHNLESCRAIQVVRSHLGDDRIGISLASAGDMDADGFLDVLVGAPGYDLHGRERDHCGAVILLRGSAIAQLVGGMIDVENLEDKGVLFIGARGMEAGYAAAGIGDINGDGFDDIAIGSGRSVQTTIVHGRADLPRIVNLGVSSERASAILNTGYCIARGGDVNGDGFSDILLGNPFSELQLDSDEGSYVGRVSVLFGGRALPPLLDPTELGEYGLSMRGRGETMTGEDVKGAGDINGDGYADFLIAAPSAGDQREGRAYLVLGQPVFQMPIEYGVIVAGAVEILPSPGDVNSDGYDDILLSAADYRCVLLWGGSGLPDRLDLREELPLKLGITFDGAIGGSGVGDVDGDGCRDIAFGLPFQSPGGRIGAGQIVVVFGGQSLPSRVNLLNPKVSCVIVDGYEPHRGFGSTLGAAGDIERDGFADIIVGAPNTPMSGQGIALDPGRAYILSGKWLVNGLADPQ